MRTNAPSSLDHRFVTFVSQRTSWCVDVPQRRGYLVRMVVEYIRYLVSNPDELIAAYSKARASLDTSPHCLAYELSAATEDPKSFVLRIEWDSAEGHLQGFRGSPEFAEFLAAVRPLINQIQEMRHYTVTDIVARKPTSGT